MEPPPEPRSRPMARSPADDTRASDPLDKGMAEAFGGAPARVLGPVALGAAGVQRCLLGLGPGERREQRAQGGQKQKKR